MLSGVTVEIFIRLLRLFQKYLLGLLYRDSCRIFFSDIPRQNLQKYSMKLRKKNTEEIFIATEIP